MTENDIRRIQQEKSMMKDPQHVSDREMADKLRGRNTDSSHNSNMRRIHNVAGEPTTKSPKFKN
jgi:hypothetical protein